MYIDYQILSVVEDMSANPQSKFDGMNCTPIALGRYDDSSKILCLSATQTNFPHLSNDKKYNIIARNKENQKTESFSGTYNNDWSFSIFQYNGTEEKKPLKEAGMRYLLSHACFSLFLKTSFVFL